MMTHLLTLLHVENDWKGGQTNLRQQIYDNFLADNHISFKVYKMSIVI